MRIAQVAPLGESVPPKKYGGTERVVYTLTEHLVSMGHKVTLFASGDSRTSARLVSAAESSLRDAGNKDPYGSTYHSMLNIGGAYVRQDEFDIIHDHNAHLSLPTALLATTPVVMTMHGAATPESKMMYDGLINKNNPYFVSISKSQRKPIPNLNWIANIYNGLDMTDFPFSKTDDGFILFVGRISAEKGIHHAIATAEYLNLPLIIAAKLDPVEMPYFEQFVKPHLNERIRWIGEVDAEERNRLMSRALCFIHPVTWREPFGLTLIEAGACGAPVVAFNKGSIPEIIKHGKNGFIVEDVSEMIEYVKNITSIKRSVCRKIALANFNGEKMAQEYEEVYKKILSENQVEKLRSEAGLSRKSFMQN
jgi:glycosyltransferase involved in cell wall biosynthesis